MYEILLTKYKQIHFNTVDDNLIENSSRYQMAACTLFFENGVGKCDTARYISDRYTYLKVVVFSWLYVIC